MRQHFNALQAARASVAEGLAKPAPDREQRERRFAEIRTQTNTTRAAFYEAFTRASASLPPEGRRAMIEALKRRPRPQLPEM